jgi:2-keto-4-pentenoate hydratase/2-oxohepta-3-ene-1,7-dioic acid hydratase in catechol pathway
MKLASFRLGQAATYGIVAGDGVIDLGRRIGARYPDLKALIAHGALADAARAAEGQQPDAGTGEVAFLPPIPNPGKIFCIGLNYDEHRQESGRDKTENPSVFTRFAESQVGHRRPMLCPRESDKFDYEGEIAIVIGKPGRRIAEADAWDHVIGYSCYNDGSVRDWQRHTTQWIPGKNFVATGAFGPWMVSADEIPPGTKLTLVTRLNGTEMQRADTGMMIFKIPRLIAYCSTFAPLSAGDVIVTGTPGGVGSRREPPVWMKPGDTVEIEVSGIGTLVNTIAQD